MNNKISRYALVSVYEKKGVIELASKLIKSGYKIIATKGTGDELKKQKIPFISCEKISKNPICFDGYMKTLSFFVEAGMLFDRSNSAHIKEAKKFGVKRIDIVICNFFPVEKIVEHLKIRSIEDVVRDFDFGGPTMVRVAAQNFKNIMVVVDPDDYKKVGQAVLLNKIHSKLKYQLAVKAFNCILDYDMQVIKYLNKK